MWIKSLCVVFSLLTFNVMALSQEASTKSPDGVELYFISPVDGATVAETFTVRFGLKGMGVAPAGVNRPGAGHHHLLVDVEVLPNLTKPLQATKNVKHFGGGQTETELTLPPGKHTLQLLLGNYAHVPHHNPIISKKITITVE